VQQDRCSATTGPRRAGEPHGPAALPKLTSTLNHELHLARGTSSSLAGAVRCKCVVCTFQVHVRQQRCDLGFPKRQTSPRFMLQNFWKERLYAMDVALIARNIIMDPAALQGYFEPFNTFPQQNIYMSSSRSLRQKTAVQYFGSSLLQVNTKFDIIASNLIGFSNTT